MQKEDFKKAIEAYKKCLMIDPDDSLTLCYMAEAYERLENFEKALDYYNKSKTITPDLADAWLGIGIVKDLQGLTNQSIAYLQQAVNLQTTNANYNLVLGEALFKLERFPESEIVLERALQLDNTYSEAIELLAKIKFEYNIVEAIEFLILCQENSKLNTNNTMLLVSLYWCNVERFSALELFKNEFDQNAENSIKYLILHLPESVKITAFKNIINPNND
jgi:tetratricopeptide (TPR) repeat protein